MGFLHVSSHVFNQGVTIGEVVLTRQCFDHVLSSEVGQVLQVHRVRPSSHSGQDNRLVV